LAFLFGGFTISERFILAGTVAAGGIVWYIE
jgi:hypothetical protein